MRANILILFSYILDKTIDKPGGASVAECKKIVVSLPDSLLKEVDNLVDIEQCNRSEFVRKAMKFYLSEMKRISFIENMKKGYLEMTEINITLAEVGLTADYETICRYESRLAECE